MYIQVVLFDGFDLLDAIAPYEVFTAAAMYTNEEVTVKLVSAEGSRMVESGVNGLKIPAEGSLDVTRGGIILLPGASGSLVGDGADSVPSKLKKATETELMPLLREAMDKRDVLLSTVCGGSLILAMDGLLQGRHAVTHHLGMEVLQATDAIPIEARVVDDGDLVTGGGVTSGLDVALYLVKRELGPQIALAVEKLFEYERRGTVWQAKGRAPIHSGNQEREEFTLKQEGEPVQPSKLSDHNIEFAGRWDTTISTPIGKLPVLLNISIVENRIYGTAQQGEEVVNLVDLFIQDNRLTWSMRVTKPMRLNLKFTVTVSGDQMSGEVKAGMLPASKLIGQRLK